LVIPPPPGFEGLSMDFTRRLKMGFGVVNGRIDGVATP
jgi:hypothetical protein